MRGTLTASVVITTRNRKDELRKALLSAVEQATKPEVLVIDDGSADGTAEMVQADFPGVRLVRHDDSLGYIVRRNEGARLAMGAVVFSIDDDAVFSTPDVVRQTLDDFGSGRVGAVAIPYIDVYTDPRVCQAAPDREAVYVTRQFKGTAYAVRRDVFVRLGGYREHLFHQGEEGDFCIRLLADGYVVRVGTADPIHHFESPNRDVHRMDFYGVRNAVLFVWENVPLPYLLVHLPVVVFRCLLLTLEPGRLKIRVNGLIDGFRQCPLVPRQPVSRSTYRAWRSFTKGPRAMATPINA